MIIKKLTITITKMILITRISLVPTQGGSVLYVCTKFEADSSFRLKLLGGPKISKLGHMTHIMPI